MTASRSGVSGHYAGAFTRLAAFLIDWFILAALYGALVAGAQWFSAAFLGFELRISDQNRWFWVAGFGIWAYSYMAVGLTITGRTPGKSLLGLKVVTRNGQPLGAGRASARVLAEPLSFVAFGLGLVGIVIGRERRALHDVIAGTAVVYDWGDRPAELPAPLTRWLQRRGVAIGPEDVSASEAHPGSMSFDITPTDDAGI